MRWSEEPAHCQTMAAEDRLWCVYWLAFSLLLMSCFLFLSHLDMHAQNSLQIVFQAQRRCPASWRRRFLEPILVLIWRRRAVCCPSVTVSLACTGWGTCRPKRWWSSPPGWRWVSERSRGRGWAIKDSRCFKMIDIQLNAHKLHWFWRGLYIIVVTDACFEKLVCICLPVNLITQCFNLKSYLWIC